MKIPESDLRSRTTAPLPSTHTASQNLILVVLCGILLIVGCSRIGKSISGNDSSGSNSQGPKVRSTADVTEETTGVPECDEVLDMLSAEADDPNEGYVAKAVKATFLNKIREKVKKSIEENKTDKVALAKNCGDFKAQLERYKADENTNK